MSTRSPSPIPETRSNRSSWLAAGLWVLLLAPFLAKLGPTGLDDVFITYRFAENFSQGDGLVFNPGDHVFGLTEPGLGLVLGLGARVSGLPVPWLGSSVTAAALLAIAILLGQAGRRRGYVASGLAAGAVLVSSPYLWACRGTAAPVVLALLIGASRIKNQAPAGLLAGLAVWFRPDAGLGTAFLAGLSWMQSRRLPWRFCVVAGLVVSGGLLGGLLYYGTPLPVTLAAKRAAASWMPEAWPTGARFWLDSLALFKGIYGVAAWPLLVLGTLGQSRLWRWGPEGRILVLYSTGILVSYPLLGVPVFPWYGTAIVVALYYGTFALIEDMARFGKHIPFPDTILKGVSVGSLVLLTFGIGVRSAHLLRTHREASHLVAYRHAGLWLREQTPEDARVTYFEIGVLGYTSHRPIQDLLGLVTPEFIPFVSRGDLNAAFRSNPTEFVVDHTVRRVGNLVEQDWFAASYELVAEFPDQGGGVVSIYRRRRLSPRAELVPKPPPETLRLAESENTPISCGVQYS